MPKTPEQSNISETKFYKLLPAVKNVVSHQLGFHLSEEEITSITQRVCEEREEDVSEFCISLDSIEFSRVEDLKDVNDTIENIIMKELTERSPFSTPPAKRLEEVRNYLDIDRLGYKESLGFMSDLYKGDFHKEFSEKHYRTVVFSNKENGKCIAVWDEGNQHCSYVDEFETESLKNNIELTKLYT